MKKISLIMAILITITMQIDAQWFWQYPSPQGNNLSKVDFISPTIGWAVGDFGTILKTTDGGISWAIQSSGTTNDLFDVDLVDSDNGTAVGRNGTILSTTNGGETWTLKASGTTNWLFGIFFADLNNGIAVGALEKY